MEVLFWSELYWPYIGGAETFGRRLVASLARRGCRITVLTSHHYLDLPDEEECDGVPIRRLPFWKALESGDPGELSVTMAAARRLVEGRRWDLVHRNGLGPGLFFHQRLLKGLAAPQLVTVQNELDDAARGGAESLQADFLRAADWRVAVSEAVLQDLRSLGPEVARRSLVIHNVTELPELPPAPLPFDPPVLLCLGRLVPEKGFDLALAAFARARRRRPGIRMIVAGEGPERPRLELLAEELGVEGAVDFEGVVPPADVPRLLNRVTGVLMPSRREGLPLVAMEAAAMARPIVATPAGGLAEVVRTGVSGWLVERESVEALSAAMLELVGRPDLTRRLGLEARRLVLESFPWDGCVEAYLELYRRSVREWLPPDP